jgi:hypothetical protein
MAPFNGDWSSSLFVSLDPVAIDAAAAWSQDELDRPTLGCSRC